MKPGTTRAPRRVDIHRLQTTPQHIARIVSPPMDCTGRCLMKHAWWTAAILAGFAFGAVVPVAHAQQQEEEEESARERGQRASASDRFCIRETGSRVTAARNARSKRAEQECVNAGGRVYTRDDIDRTGSVDVKDALRRLDPSIF